MADNFGDSEAEDRDDLPAWNERRSKEVVLTKSETAEKWINRWIAAERVYSGWAHRFKVPVLYQYYEGYQHLIDQDENNRPYVVNLIYSTIEQKMPNLLFDNPIFVLRPHPYGEQSNLNDLIGDTQLKEDALNYVVGRECFGFNDKHELALLDAFFGFGVVESGYSKDRLNNPNLNSRSNDPLDNLYCKQIPFDTFRVSSAANWDLSTGKWWGYYEFVPYSALKKYIDLGIITLPPNAEVDDQPDFATMPVIDGQIIVGEGNKQIPPNNTVKCYFIEDFEKMERLVIAPDDAQGSDRILSCEKMEYSRIDVLRFGKRRRGWYPLPPVFNWLSPQDEINDIRQAQKIHRKRFSRKYGVLENAVEPEEMDKALYGPDGTMFKVKKPVSEAIQLLPDGQMDMANDESMKVSYGDMDRVSGATSNLTPTPDRETATSASITSQRAQIRESKEVIRVSNFMCDFARTILRTLGEVPKGFWVSTKVPEGLFAELKGTGKSWKKIDKTLFKEEDYDVDMTLSSISPVYQAQDKKTFLEFLAVITQYEILSISPALLREAAYRIGYKNSAVMNEFQQLAQLMMVGKMAQAKQQAAAAGAIPQGPQNPMAANQIADSTPPDMESIRNMLFSNQPPQ